VDDDLRIIDQFLEVGDLKRAEVQIARLLRGDPDSLDRVQLLMRRARGRLMAEKPDDALEDLLMCRNLQPSLEMSAELLELLGDVYFARFELAPVGFADRTDVEQAQYCYDSLIDQSPDYANLGWILYQKGRILLSENRIDSARAAFESALTKPSRISSLAALCYERLGFIGLFENRQPDVALEFFSRAVEVYPPGENAGWLVQLHILRSRALREQKLFPEALVAARQALSTIDTAAPDYRRALPEAHLAVGETLAQIAGREEEAIEHLVQFLQLSKRPLGVDLTWSRVQETIGDLSFRLGRYQLAVESYNTALEFNPYHPLEYTIFYQMARCYYRLQAYEKVLETVDRMQHAAAAEDETIQDYRVFNVLGNAYFALEQYKAAVVAYRQALQLAPPGAEQLEQIKSYLAFAEDLGTQASHDR
jgi:tetratricopeptide (TPR) repeat protein